jgi:hypothetical protein
MSEELICEACEKPGATNRLCEDGEVAALCELCNKAFEEAALEDKMHLLY